MAVFGGGSTYTPELISGLDAQRARLPVDELVLLDPDPVRLDAVGGLARRILRKQSSTTVLTMTQDRDRALDGKDVVLVKRRVGGQAARLIDETLSFDFGCIEQEAADAGGIATALRRVPIVLEHEQA